MKTLVIGARGMLGRLLVPALQLAGHQVVTSSLDDPTTDFTFDFSDWQKLNAVLDAVQPGLVINCAAYTAVDRAESEPVPALLANVYGPKLLAQGAKKFSYRLIHISTDYVYGSTTQRTPLDESTEPNPCSMYGHSKLLGDEFISAIAGDCAAIFRTCWLHAESGPNFVATIRRLAGERKELKIVNDQFGSPTYAGWLARAIVKFIPLFTPGVFHAANRGAVSWHEFAKRICSLSQFDIEVLEQTTAELDRPAPRPPYSALDCTKLERLLSEPCQSWEEGLEEHLQKL